MKATTKVLACLLVMVVTGCVGRYIGGGWIPSADLIEGDKMHFTANIEAADCEVDGIADTFGGSVRVNDTGVGITFTCIIENVVILATFAEATGTVVDASGFTTPPDSCTVQVASIPAGQAIFDFISVEAFVGGTSVYSNSGQLEGGNTQFLKATPRLCNQQ